MISAVHRRLVQREWGLARGNWPSLRSDIVQRADGVTSDLHATGTEADGVGFRGDCAHRGEVILTPLTWGDEYCVPVQVAKRFQTHPQHFPDLRL